MDKFKKVKVIGNVIGFNIDASGKETYNVQFPDMTVAELESYQFEDADAYHTNGKPLCLRNVLARLRGLPEHDREVWMDEIMHEFANDYGSVKYTLGYKQGKLDGAVEAEKSNKVVIPRFVANIIEYYKKENAPIVDIFTEKDIDKEYAWWLATDFNAYDRVARAWLDGYSVEPERRYKAVLPNLYEEENVLHFSQEDEVWYFNNDFNDNVSVDKDSRYHTRKELEDAGFGWVFDCEDVEVQEVQEVE